MNILIIDDHPLVCQGIKNILLTQVDIVNVFEANDIDGALTIMSEHKIGLALVDVRLKGEDGIDFIIEAKKRFKDVKYVVLSSSSTADDFNRAMDAKVDGYILKDSLPEDIIYAVRTVLRGRKHFDPIFLDMEDPLDELSPREKEILECIAKGLTNKDIADKLFISENTVKRHVTSILSKLNLENRIQAAMHFKSI